MEEHEKYQALEKIWYNWTGDLTNEYEVAELESEMHKALKPNKRELNKLSNDIFIRDFMNEKLQEDLENHERITCANLYYGV